MRKLNVKRLILFFITLILIVVFSVLGFFFYKLSPIEKGAEEITYQVELGKNVYDIFEDLENEGIIRSAFALKLYSKIKGAASIDAGNYTLSKSMSSTEIYDVLSQANTLNADETKITLIEGTTIKDLADTVASKTNITKEEFLSTINDKDYVKELISIYWFLTDDILNENIYYALEGYLYPDTYNISKDSTSKDIIEKILEGTKNKLDEYKSDFENNSLTAHQIFTLASVLESEGYTLEDKRGIAGAIMNRLEDGILLQIDSTTYYGLSLELGTRDLYESEINDCSNNYNTYCNLTLPIGPISNPSLESIKAALSPEDNSYYFWVSDKYNNIYFSKTNSEHESTISRLIREGLWHEYE